MSESELVNASTRDLQEHGGSDFVGKSGQQSDSGCEAEPPVKSKRGTRRSLWAGLDVGVETTSVCILDSAGEVIHEASCPTSIKNVHRELARLRRRRHARVGMEAATGMTLARGLRNLGYNVDLYEQRQLSKFLRLRRNKTDANDALGIAEAGMLGAGTVSKVHLKSFECQCLQSRLAIRRHLVRQRVAAVNMLARQLELFGGRFKCGNPARLRSTAEAEIRKVFGRPQTELTADLHQLLNYCEQLVDHQRAVDCALKSFAIGNEVCRRLMEIPGVGAIRALTFYASVSDPYRFRRSADVGPYFGLTPTINQSGLSFKTGRISKMGNRNVREALVSAAMTFMCYAGESDLRSWTRTIEERRGKPKARVALARKLAVLMVAMWKNGTRFQPRTTAANRAAAPAGLDLARKS